MRTVFTHMRNLRKKLEVNPSNPVHIQTIPRDGYIFHQ
ncbi:MAG: helix-turn-helix domain-containing protein [Clostridia bacterium]|nr:helix-turn-helix domain-containing protein [Clostridia bacterium]